MSFGVEPAASVLDAVRGALVDFEGTAVDSRHEFSPRETPPGGRPAAADQARESLDVLEEQVAVWNDALDDARIRALVSETPLQSKEYEELARHVAVANVEMKRASNEVRELVRARDELLREWSPKEDRG